MKCKIISIFLFFLQPLSATASDHRNRVDYRAEFNSEDLARRFFGPLPKKELEKIAVSVSRIDIDLKTEINCGKINIAGTIHAEMEKLDKMLTLTLSELRNLNPAQLALASVCATEPELCTYARDMGAKFGDIFAMQFNVCNSIDSYINDKAEQGKKSMIRRKYLQCLGQKEGGYSTEDSSRCLAKAKKEADVRNLLKPFAEAYTEFKQNVLDSILTAAKESDHYDILAKVLGEVELQKNGLWVKAYPKGRLTPAQTTTNFLANAEENACDISELERIVNSSDPEKDKEGIDKYTAATIKEKITPEIIFDLKSIPDKEKNIICLKLGDSIGESAIKKFEAETKSSMAVSLKNNALPEDIRVFYETNTEQTFEAIIKKIAAKEILPFSEIRNNLQILAINYRKAAHDAAAGASRNRNANARANDLFKCIDTATCDKRGSLR